MSHAVLGFAWSQRNTAERGTEHQDGTGWEKGSCFQTLNWAQAAPEAAHHKVQIMDSAVVLHSKDAERFHSTGSNLRLIPGELLVLG